MLVKAYESAVRGIELISSRLGIVGDDRPSLSGLDFGSSSSPIPEEVAASILNASEGASFDELRLLAALFRRPYDDGALDFDGVHVPEADLERRFYRLPPRGAAKAGGVGFMS